MLHFLHFYFGDWRFVFSRIREADFRCPGVILSCLATLVFVEKKLKKIKNLYLKN